MLPVLYATQWLMTAFACPFPFQFAARIVDILLRDSGSDILLSASMAVMARLQPCLMEQHDFEALVRCLKMDPVDWDDVVCRDVIDTALLTPLTVEELHAVQSLQRTLAADWSGVASAAAASVTPPFVASERSSSPASAAGAADALSNSSSGAAADASDGANPPSTSTAADASEGANPDSTSTAADASGSAMPSPSADANNGAIGMPEEDARNGAELPGSPAAARASSSAPSVDDASVRASENASLRTISGVTGCKSQQATSDASQVPDTAVAMVKQIRDGASSREQPAGSRLQAAAATDEAALNTEAANAEPEAADCRLHAAGATDAGSEATYAALNEDTADQD